VINYAFCGENEMRFVAANQDVKLGNDIEATLGATTIEQVWIIGYPSLLNIKDEVLVMNIGGSTAIVDYLMDVPNGI
jgi:hypothetical protein